ncbi:hypothetical protein [Mycobacterium palustre]|uniref:Uncharacterized protein n=1 Tax=Mycobacterium palustre TaxID=153971 RepID=A0A1X1Z6C7_9MYCO|nr:hypothetical protein [Mycobacterium palustre]MCV7102152.1 hypothetical protein [Mycobacterium palustre]ORW18855.1 hypothetical protein AWC19_18995 [Mycobacterium palustre]
MRGTRWRHHGSDGPGRRRLDPPATETGPVSGSHAGDGTVTDDDAAIPGLIAAYAPALDAGNAEFCVYG